MRRMALKMVGGSLCLVAIIFSGCATTQQAERVYPYPFDSARIEYQLTGNVEGAITVLIKGDQSVHEATAASGEEQIHTKFIDLGDTLYQMDLNAGQGQKAANPIYQQLKNMSADERAAFLTKLAVGVPPEGDMPESKGQKEVAGQTCDLYDLQGIGETCIWNGIPLYSSMTIPEAGIENVNTATSIQLNVDIPDEAFNVPEGVSIAELPSQ